jgi:activator of 2-hydroxyglutaryl-CoA dehydratase
VSVDLVVADENGRIIKTKYVRHKGRPFETAREILEENINSDGVDYVATTGTGAKLFSSLIGASCINEIVAITKGFSSYYPQTGSVIDIGGEDSKLIIFEAAGKNGKLR